MQIKLKAADNSLKFLNPLKLMSKPLKKKKKSHKSKYKIPKTAKNQEVLESKKSLKSSTL